MTPCFAKITSHINTSFKAFLAKMGTLGGNTRPASHFLHLTRLSRSARSRFSHGLPTSPAFFALGKAFAERREQIFAWSADQPRVFRTWQGFRGAQGVDFRMVCRPALRFPHLARLSRSAGSRFSHGLPTSPAFFAYLAWCITLLLSFVLNYSHILQRGQRCGAVRRSFRSNFIANSCGRTG